MTSIGQFPELEDPALRQASTTEAADAVVDEHGHDPNVAHHFDDAQQQFDSGKLGMWVFLLTEVLFFSGLFCVYAIYRMLEPEAFASAASRLDVTLGAVNTGVLIISSLTAAWSVRCAQLGQQRGLLWTLGITIACGFGFLVIKAIEYSHKIHDGLLPGRFFAPVYDVMQGEQTFFSVYFSMTGLHGLHVIIGIGLYIWLFVAAMRGRFGPKRFAAVDNVALYWHLVDLIWIYLFPLLYLING